MDAAAAAAEEAEAKEDAGAGGGIDAEGASERPAALERSGAAACDELRDSRRLRDMVRLRKKSKMPRSRVTPHENESDMAVRCWVCLYATTGTGGAYGRRGALRYETIDVRPCSEQELGPVSAKINTNQLKI
ncbi:uncharacterized protein IUM83_07292 [Phytophthora cinnamomi]|uniref:uncharacterized protein n=1 Tax=Phytophthora cinnamomi TaxID=4785 RepID=UPI003559EBD3|nr:hypothetical protein IUM83_07292 [Phytophthora cinnamomi]